MYECDLGCNYCSDFNKPHIERFYKYVDKEANKTNCWYWTGTCTPAGYGTFSYMGKRVYAHRFLFSLHKQLSKDMEIDHLCNNRNCVNLAHLEQVDHRTNVVRGHNRRLLKKAR